MPANRAAGLSYSSADARVTDARGVTCHADSQTAACRQDGAVCVPPVLAVLTGLALLRRKSGRESAVARGKAAAATEAKAGPQSQELCELRGIAALAPSRIIAAAWSRS